MYFTVLERFDVTDLETQAKLLLEYEDSLIGKNNKSKRRMLKKQRERVQSRIEELQQQQKNMVCEPPQNPQHRVGIKAGGIWRE